MTGPLWEHSGVSGWKFKGVLGTSVHLNVKEALGGLGRTPLPGSSGERADCWEACGKGLKTSTFLQTALVSIKWRFLTKTWVFSLKTPSPWHLGSLSSALSSAEGEGGFDLEPITVVSERWCLCLGISPCILKAGKWYLATLWGCAGD